MHSRLYILLFLVFNLFTINPKNLSFSQVKAQQEDEKIEAIESTKVVPSTAMVQSYVSQLIGKFSNNFSFSALNDGVNNELVIIKMMKEAMKDFLGGNFSNFDATAGDTCCQTRAHKLLEIIKKTNDIEFQKLIKDFLTELESNETILIKINEETFKLIASKEIKFPNLKNLQAQFQNNSLGKSLGVFLSFYGLNYSKIPDDFKYIILNHMVTQYHSETFDYLELKRKLLALKFFPLTKKILEQIILTAREKLSEDTNNHMINFSHQLRDSTLVTFHPNLNRLSNMFQLIEDQGVYPPFKSRSCYASFYIILSDWWLKKQPFMSKIAALCDDHGYHTYDEFYIPVADEKHKEIEYRPLQFSGLGDKEIKDLKLKLENQALPILEGVASLEPTKYASMTYNELTAYFSKVFEKCPNDHLDTVNVNSTQNGQICHKMKDYIIKLGSASYLKIYMGNGAKHPQFVDKNKSNNFDLITNLESREQEKERFQIQCDEAMREGCCFENMEMLRLTHVFVDQSKNAQGKVKADTNEIMKIELLRSITELEAKLQTQPVPNKSNNQNSKQKQSKPSGSKEEEGSEP
jgi:hypothetical protein